MRTRVFNQHRLGSDKGKHGQNLESPENHEEKTAVIIVKDCNGNECIETLQKLKILERIKVVSHRT